MGRRMDAGVEGCEDGEKVGDGDGSCGFVGRESAHRITREGFEYMILTHDLYTCKKFVISFPTRTHAHTHTHTERERQISSTPPPPPHPQTPSLTIHLPTANAPSIPSTCSTYPIQHYSTSPQILPAPNKLPTLHNTNQSTNHINHQDAPQLPPPPYFPPHNPHPRLQMLPPTGPLHRLGSPQHGGVLSVRLAPVFPFPYPLLSPLFSLPFSLNLTHHVTNFLISK